MLSVLVKGGAAEARSVCNHARVFTQATSLGATESLIEHRQSVEEPTPLSPPNLLRVSVGLEHVDDLKADLDSALRAMHK